MNYYCLIAGLPDIKLDDKNVFTTISELKTELMELLSTADAELLKLLFVKYDNQNWLKLLFNKDADINRLGNLKSEDFEQLITMLRELENPKDTRLLPFVQKFYSTCIDEDLFPEAVLREDYLTGLYYEYAMRCDNLFLQSWFEFNLNINNLLTALLCRKHALDQRVLVIGDNEIAQMLRTGYGHDFGLAGMFDQLEDLIKIAEETDLYEREKKLDALKWDWLEEHTFFHYFSIERILAFVLKLEIIERWKPLSVEKGNHVFSELLAGMKQKVKFEEL